MYLEKVIRLYGLHALGKSRPLSLLLMLPWLPALGACTRGASGRGSGGIGRGIYRARGEPPLLGAPGVEDLIDLGLAVGDVLWWCGRAGRGTADSGWLAVAWGGHGFWLFWL